jgi:hypothetical protein
MQLPFVVGVHHIIEGLWFCKISSQVFSSFVEKCAGPQNLCKLILSKIANVGSTSMPATNQLESSPAMKEDLLPTALQGQCHREKSTAPTVSINPTETSCPAPSIKLLSDFPNKLRIRAIAFVLAESNLVSNGQKDLLLEIEMDAAG